MAQTLVLLAGAAFLLYRYGLSTGGDGTADAGRNGYTAYSKGYRDAQRGDPYDPIADEPLSSSNVGGGWGLGKLFNLAMAGSMVYQLGGQPWSVDNIWANARNMNPVNMIIMVQMLSSFLG